MATSAELGKARSHMEPYQGSMVPVGLVGPGAIFNKQLKHKIQVFFSPAP